MTAIETIQALKRIMGISEIKKETFGAVKNKGTFDVPPGAADPYSPPQAGQTKTLEDQLKALESRVAALETQVKALATDKTMLKAQLQKHEKLASGLFAVNEQLIKEQEELSQKLPYNEPFYRGIKIGKQTFDGKEIRKEREERLNGFNKILKEWSSQDKTS